MSGTTHFSDDRPWKTFRFIENFSNSFPMTDYKTQLYLLMTGGLQGVVFDFMLPLCNLSHLHVHL